MSKLLGEMFRPKSAEATLRGSSRPLIAFTLRGTSVKRLRFTLPESAMSHLRTAVIHPARVEVRS